MNYFLIGACIAALLLFAVVRPRWRHIGPSLLDSYVIGLLLFASGSISIWIDDQPASEIIMQIALSAALSGTLGAALWGYLFRSRISRIDFFGKAKRLRADAWDESAHDENRDAVAIEVDANSLAFVRRGDAHIRLLYYSWSPAAQSSSSDLLSWPSCGLRRSMRELMAFAVAVTSGTTFW